MQRENAKLEIFFPQTSSHPAPSCRGSPKRVCELLGFARLEPLLDALSIVAICFKLLDFIRFYEFLRLQLKDFLTEGSFRRGSCQRG